MSGMTKYSQARKETVMRNGLRSDMSKNPDIDHYKAELAKAEQRLAAEEKLGDEKRIAKAQDIVNNLKGTINRMEGR